MFKKLHTDDTLREVQFDFAEFKQIKERKAQKEYNDLTSELIRAVNETLSAGGPFLSFYLHTTTNNPDIMDKVATEMITTLLSKGFKHIALFRDTSPELPNMLYYNFYFEGKQSLLKP